MAGLKARAIQVARRAVKGGAALALHYSGAREFLSAVQRRAVGGRRVLILSYHRVVQDFAEEAERGGLHTLNVGQKTFRHHLEVLQETHDIVSLDDALAVLDGSRRATRDVAVITFDDGYRDVFTWAFPAMRAMRVPGIVYVPSAFIGTDRRLGHDRLWTALERMRKRGIGPMAVGVSGEWERWLTRAFEGASDTHHVLERLIARHPTPGLLRLCDALEDRLGLNGQKVPEGHLPMTWDMLREMDAHGVSTGGHTAEHTVLTNYRLDEARREIALCKATIERHLKKPIAHFAYCNGYYSAGVAQALRAEGFVSAVTTEDMPNVPGVDPYALKRKVLWEASSLGILGNCSKALTACQFADTFQMLAVQKPVIGARPTNFERAPPEHSSLAAHG